MRFIIEIDETDTIEIRIALRQRSRALHTMADELFAREPGEPGWKHYRNKGNELFSLADRISVGEPAVADVISCPPQHQEE